MLSYLHQHLLPSVSKSRERERKPLAPRKFLRHPLLSGTEYECLKLALKGLNHLGLPTLVTLPPTVYSPVKCVWSQHERLLMNAC